MGRSFTHGDSAIAPHVVEMYLTAMVDAGLIRLDGDIYSVTEAGADYLDSLPKMTPGPMYGPWSVKEKYKSPAWPARSGAFDHLRHKSLGAV